MFTAPVFDLERPSGSSGTAKFQTKIEACTEIEVNSDLCPKSSPSQMWEIDVRQLVSSTTWLQTYGLRKNRLDMKGMLPMLGFRHADGIKFVVVAGYMANYTVHVQIVAFQTDLTAVDIVCLCFQILITV